MRNSLKDPQSIAVATPTLRGRRSAGLGIRLGGLFGVAALVLFHLLLLWRRLEDLSLLEPPVILRWLATVALLGALVYLGRSGIPLLRGRKALVLWLLVLLLHVSVAAPGPAGEPDSGGLAEAALQLTLALPAVGSTALLLLLALMGLLAHGGLALSAAKDPWPRTAIRVPSSFLQLNRALPSLANRPPPQPDLFPHRSS